MKTQRKPVQKTARTAAAPAILLAAVLALLGAPAFAGGSRQDEPRRGGLSVLVYITGMLAGSPPYELLAAGAERFAAAHEGVTVKIYEAGFNQAEWEEQLTSLVASGEYDIVLGSNPSLPEICVSVGEKFPRQKFIITDAQYEGNPQICTYLYNQYEQSLYLGYLAGLVTVSGMPRANPAKRLGFIAAQEYPLLNNHILPGFLAGAKLADPDITVDFRVIGNWYDANKAAELAGSMIDAGADVFAVIAGGAAQGLIKTAGERGAYIVYHNTNEYRAAPGVILGCGLMKQEKLVEEILSDAAAGKVQYGVSRTVGAAEGYLDFIADDPGYRDYVPPEIQAKFAAFLARVKAGQVDYTLPPL
ncbi:MAG: BMP family ABC transporter substrate-binding protein [Spirochaetaceae bacterium]|jgi:simple sugar transport system substrate-binding protein|nr:BMP family ABC transporter substrate-binding protein [Spirochaetaceae bacterium]